MKCRHCGTPAPEKFLDLGSAPFSNSYLTSAQLSETERHFPLRIHVCKDCWLVQTEDHARANDLFTSNYAYFSSTSTGWVEHVNQYAKVMQHQLKLSHDSFVVEIACNDGCLLKNFVAMGIPCLGIEPTDSTAAAAEETGVPVKREFFTEELGRKMGSDGMHADLIAGNNVYAHVPDINDFTRGLKFLLKPNGCITLEFPHLMQLLQLNQFDTVYHEHFSYFSLYTVDRIFAKAGLRIWDVNVLPTHGGSLRIFGCHDNDPRSRSGRVDSMIQTEAERGMRDMNIYQGFQDRADRVKDDLVHFLSDAKQREMVVAAYGAAAKGNTLLNYAGIKSDHLPFVCDAAPSKQGKFMPGSQIPIYSPAVLKERTIDYLLILPWNIQDEIRAEYSWLSPRVRFVTAVPQLSIQ